ncbi:uncharacterized protein NDAI_0J00780 [Naumovozyma dairenensis CBS 421]|uniref:Transmembrane protein n=1 Tax=Naumovozyma dairenensis (strain ATCC 10597 / BCRC 20456 / CBS 421 / NBRC 0211 / NRRL Y-12639) TaxID=1071378 RepID=G0WGP2_NAUDC|nr:hypothetical protein NDAI_0J00780 [Naumovozyma dairenensis CBS 421]CCD26970.1 hypothetical protein NDAI_0J00780 [Naumovozyma dairenensis CBS 421]
MYHLIETELTLMDGIPQSNEIKRIFLLDRYYPEITVRYGQIKYWNIAKDIPALSQDIVDIFIFHERFIIILASSTHFYGFTSQILTLPFVSCHTMNLFIILEHILDYNEVRCLGPLRNGAPSKLPIILDEREAHIKIYVDIRHNLRELEINSKEIRKFSKKLFGVYPKRPVFFYFSKRSIERRILWQEAMFYHLNFTSNQRWIVWSSSIVGLCCIPPTVTGIIIEPYRPDHVSITISTVALAIIVISAMVLSNQPSFTGRYLKCWRIAAFLYLQNGIIKSCRMIFFLKDLDKEAEYYKKEGEGEGEGKGEGEGEGEGEGDGENGNKVQKLLRALPYYPINNITDIPESFVLEEK